MNRISAFFLLFLFAFVSQTSLGQSADSTQTVSTFSGSVGFTNNGFSIVPTFSLNSPATIMNFYWRKKRFSFDPDIRLVPDASKGGLIFWFRYRLIEQKKFSLRVGAHPAFTLIRRNLTENGNTTEITELLRFLAFEVVPNYQITPHWSIGAVYLHGSGLQKHGPQNTDVFFLNSNISNITLGGDFRLQLIPMVYLLLTDGHRGTYFSATALLSRKNFPFTLQSTINQTFTSTIPGNKDFMWNVMVAYNFSRNFKNVH
ncbi:hypothetical protein [Runella slithyformis]|uniref:Uncharacterized protein n=1 Tax=Runella slithyformis (strain ATCC 29530 / DSM 19594 / LMG 11500 / NCIMB 11436 / LSU 4) TaxID=761193 RepID=A0A7U3ZGU0_RUNSL|nr:hypothetical protein [Runella slithyformis]AEI46958.1 hypothetical protein Runsl_0514 [Runella slithyformis DSM 19594]